MLKLQCTVMGNQWCQRVMFMALLLGVCSCVVRRSFAIVNESSAENPSASRFEPLILLRDKARLRASELQSDTISESLNTAGFVTSENVPVKGFEILSDSATGEGVEIRVNLAGKEVKTRRFERSVKIDMPEDGWWVSPIHSTLLSNSGKVLLTGWGRRDRDTKDSVNLSASACTAERSAFHSGTRRYGVSFVFDPNRSQSVSAESVGESAVDLFAKLPGGLSYFVKGIREVADPQKNFFQRQVLYCSGQTTLPDGKILYTGGSQYRNLGASGLQRELIRWRENNTQKEEIFDNNSQRHKELLQNVQTTQAKIFIQPARDLDEIEFGLEFPSIYDPNAAPGANGTQSFVNLEADGYREGLGPEIAGEPTFGDSGNPQQKKRFNTMWYPTNTRLPNGRILVIGGNYRWDSGREISNRSIQIFDYKCFVDPSNCTANGVWGALGAHENVPEEIASGIRDYVHSILLPKPIELNCPDTGRRGVYTAALSGFRGDWFFLDTESPLSENPIPSKEETRIRFCRAPGGHRHLADNDADAKADGWNSSSALLYTGEILRMGGSGDPRVAQRVDVYNPYAPGCENISEVTEGRLTSCPAHRFIHTGITRESPMTVLLPDGRVLISGGWDDGIDFKAKLGDFRQEANARTRIQIVDPGAGLYSPEGAAPRLVAQRSPTISNFQGVVSQVDQKIVFTEDPWTDHSLSDQEKQSHPELSNERGYHSFATLLKDARILIGGGTHAFGNVGCERPSLQIYSPPYLDRPELRPRFTEPGADDKVFDLRLGGSRVFRYDGKKLRAPKQQAKSFGRSGAVLMAPGSATHGFDQNQRYVGLDYRISAQDPNAIEVFGPAQETLAPVGQYLLFLVSEEGVPSKGLSIHLLRGN